MKKIIKYLPIAILACSFFAACHKGNKAMETAKKNVETTSAAPAPYRKPPEQTIVPVNEIPPATASKKAYLSTGYWIPQGAMQPSDSTVFQQYKGKILKFREDLTFDILVLGKIVDTGHWNFDSEKATLYLSCKDPYYNSTWQVIEKSFTMIWVGQTSINRSGIQIKVKSFNELSEQ